MIVSFIRTSEVDPNFEEHVYFVDIDGIDCVVVEDIGSCSFDAFEVEEIEHNDDDHIDFEVDTSYYDEDVNEY